MELATSRGDVKKLTVDLEALTDHFTAEFEIVASHADVVRAELQASKHEKDALYVALEEAEQAANDLSDSNRRLVEERQVLQCAAAPEALAIFAHS